MSENQIIFTCLGVHFFIALILWLLFRRFDEGPPTNTSSYDHRAYEDSLAAMGVAICLWEITIPIFGLIRFVELLEYLTRKKSR